METMEEDEEPTERLEKLSRKNSADVAPFQFQLKEDKSEFPEGLRGGERHKSQSWYR